MRGLGVFKLLLGIIFLLPHFASSQQLPLFSQYVFNTLHVNPGYAGYKMDPFVQFTYRSQYIDFPGAPRTFSFSGDMSSYDDRMGFGISFLSDRMGATRTNTGLLTYAYRIQTGENSYLGLGVSGGASEYALDGSLLRPEDDTDATIPSGTLNTMTPNLNTGLFFHSDRFFSGISIFNLVGKRILENQDIALAFHNVHYYLQVGGLIPVSDQLEFKPSVLVRHDQKGPTNFDINAMLLFYKRLWLGGAYRSHIPSKQYTESTLSNRNAIAVMAEIFATDNLRIGYAYDYNMNVLTNYRNNSHEVSVGFYFGSRGLDDGMLKCF